MQKYKSLFYFHSQSYEIIEIKRLGMKEGSAPGEVYHWLLISNSTRIISKLHFTGMSDYSRTFEEGLLSFNEVSGEFKSSELNLILERKNPEEISPHTHHVISNFILSLP